MAAPPVRLRAENPGNKEPPSIGQVVSPHTMKAAMQAEHFGGGPVRRQYCLNPPTGPDFCRRTFSLTLTPESVAK